MGPGARHPDISQVLSTGSSSNPSNSLPSSSLAKKKPHVHATASSATSITPEPPSLERDLANGNPARFRLTVDNSTRDSSPGFVHTVKVGVGRPLTPEGHKQQQQQQTSSRQEAQEKSWSSRGNGGPRDDHTGEHVAQRVSAAAVTARGEGITSRHYPGAFSKEGRGGGGGEDEGSTPDDDVGDGSEDGGGSGVRQRVAAGADLLPKEIYQKLSDYVIGQVCVYRFDSIRIVD